MPVHDGVVDTEDEALFAAFVGQRFEQTFAVGSRVDHVVIGGRRIEQAESIVVLGRDHDVTHARVFGDLHPLGRIELHGIELLGQLLVFRDRDVGTVHNPLAEPVDLLAVPAAGWNRIQAPVDKHAEARVAPPLHAGIALGRCFCRRGRNDHRQADEEIKRWGSGVGDS